MKHRGATEALRMFKLAEDPGMIGRLLHSILDLGTAGFQGARSGLLDHASRARALRDKGVGVVGRNLTSAPGSALAALKGFHAAGGTGAAAHVGVAGLAGYGAHQLYKNHVEPQLPGGAPAYPPPYAGMF